jgi:hypothetical protein
MGLERRNALVPSHLKAKPARNILTAPSPADAFVGSEPGTKGSRLVKMGPGGYALPLACAAIAA